VMIERDQKVPSRPRRRRALVKLSLMKRAGQAEMKRAGQAESYS
jgi:hypothetical protein